MLRSRIKTMCQERGETVYSVARRAGLSPDCLYLWERRGLDGAELAGVLAVARALRAQTEELYEEVV